MSFSQTLAEFWTVVVALLIVLDPIALMPIVILDSFAVHLPGGA